MRFSTAKLAMVLALMMFTASPAFAIEFEWTDASGSVKSLADYKGKPIVLHFWASWCPPCRNEMPELEAWSKVHDDVELVVVTLDRNINDAIAFLDAKEIDFPALQGDMMRAQQLGIRGLPTTLVIGADSTIRRTRTGAVKWDSAEDGGAILAALRSEN